MTDESHMDPTEQPSEAAATESESSVTQGAGDFTSGEGLVAFAGIVLVAAWFLFDLIIDNYGMDNLIPVIAAVALLLPRLNREMVERVAPLPVLMKVSGWALVFLGVIELLLDIRIGFYDDAGTIIGALVAYAGYVMAFIGARQIKI